MPKLVKRFNKSAQVLQVVARVQKLDLYVSLHSHLPDLNRRTRKKIKGSQFSTKKNKKKTVRGDGAN